MTARPRPLVGVECVVFGCADAGLQVLLRRRADKPFKGRWELPGGWVGRAEAVDAAAQRELSEQTGIASAFLEQLYTFGAPDRDPRGRKISVAYFGLVRDLGLPGLADAVHAQAVAWHPAADPPALAFDHAEILATARRRLQAKVRYQPIGFELLPRKFTLSQIQRVYEAVLGRPLDKRNFRKKLLATGLLTPLAETERAVAHRAARLYRFDARKYHRLVEQGFHFEV